jgi:Rieske 2Fe-2S family protein
VTLQEWTAADLVSEGDDGRSFFRGLPREYYVSDEVFEREFEAIFSRQWLLAGHSCQLREAGDFFTVDVAGENIIVARAADGEVHALYNVCRHRGSQVCDGTSGRAASFVCPYHGWSYAPDGSLLSAPNMLDGEYIDYDKLGLKHAHAYEHKRSGLVFINLGADPAPLDEAMDQNSDLWQRHQTDRVKLIREKVVEVDVNWKLINENNQECYHCEPNHALLCAGVYVPDFSKSLPAEGQHFAVTTPNFVGGPGGGGQLNEGYQSLTVDGARACQKMLGEISPDADERALGFHGGPVYNNAHVWPDYLMLTNHWPLSKDRTRVKLQWYVHEDAVEGVDYEVDHLTAVMDVTLEEDLALLQRQARGVRSRAYEPGPMSKAAETLNHRVLALYLDWMAARRT